MEYKQKDHGFLNSTNFQGHVYGDRGAPGFPWDVVSYMCVENPCWKEK